MDGGGGEALPPGSRPPDPLGASHSPAVACDLRAGLPKGARLFDPARNPWPHPPACPVHLTLPAPCPLDLDSTLHCGQAFRWNAVVTEEGLAWEGVQCGVFFRLRHDRPHALLHVEASDANAAGLPLAAFLARYLHLSDFLPAIAASLPQDPVMQRAFHLLGGLRLVQQEPWECLVSFVCSRNTNVGHIKQVVERMAVAFGDRQPGFYAFPSPEAVARQTPEALNAACRFRYDMHQAREIHAAAQRIACGEFSLEALWHTPYAEALAALTTLRGIGRKVADCVLLFAYNKMDAFPVDVHLGRALLAWYPHLLPTARRPAPAGQSLPSALTDRDKDRLGRAALGYFGPWCGYAEEYLFTLYRYGHDPVFRAELDLLWSLSGKQGRSEALRRAAGIPNR